jgi:hypothetical protein
MFRDHLFPQRALSDVPLIRLGQPFLFFWRGPPTFAYQVHPFLVNPSRALHGIAFPAFQTALLVFLSTATRTRIISADSVTNRVCAFGVSCGFFRFFRQFIILSTR